MPNAGAGHSITGALLKAVRQKGSMFDRKRRQTVGSDIEGSKDERQQTKILKDERLKY